MAGYRKVFFSSFLNLKRQFRIHQVFHLFMCAGLGQENSAVQSKHRSCQVRRCNARQCSCIGPCFCLSRNPSRVKQFVHFLMLLETACSDYQEFLFLMSNIFFYSLAVVSVLLHVFRDRINVTFC